MPPNIKSRWPRSAPANKGGAPSALKSGAKKVASKALDAAGPGMSVGTTSTGTGAIALATGAAAASTMGVALVAAGAIATLGAAGKSVVAARSSKQHRDALTLVKAFNRRQEFDCNIPPESEGEPDLMAHGRISSNVLPYAIEQKDTKFKRKAVGSVPVLGTIPMAFLQLKHAFKADKGVMRTQMAYELAVHLVTHNCPLAQTIVAELFSSYDKMLWMLDQDTDTITPLIAEKLKSV